MKNIKGYEYLRKALYTTMYFGVVIAKIPGWGLVAGVDTDAGLFGKNINTNKLLYLNDFP